MLDIKGTKTEENLKKAFAGESEARNKYTYYGNRAREDGYEQIGNIFDETADNEREHAEIWYKLLNGGIGTTLENLEKATTGESYEAQHMYREFAKQALEDGLDEIAAIFEGVAEIEKSHNDRYMKLKDNIENGKVFSRDNDTMWQCLNCGYIHVGKEAPERCPVCGYPQSYFQIMPTNY